MYVVSVHFLILALGESGLGNLAGGGLLVVQRACGWEPQHSMHTFVFAMSEAAFVPYLLKKQQEYL